MFPVLLAGACYPALLSPASPAALAAGPSPRAALTTGAGVGCSGHREPPVHLSWSFVPAGLQCGSALFRHEIGYVLGQLQHEAAVPQLTATLAQRAENPMVRHECAEALGAIARPACLAALRAHAADPERVVRESCEVALDMYEYETGSAFQYADGLEQLRAAPS